MIAKKQKKPKKPKKSTKSSKMKQTKKLYNMSTRGTTVILTPPKSKAKASLVWLHGFGSGAAAKAP